MTDAIDWFPPIPSPLPCHLVSQTHMDEIDLTVPVSALKSSFYEQLVEHVFISEVLQEAWYRYRQTVEVLRSEIDALLGSTLYSSVTGFFGTFN